MSNEMLKQITALNLRGLKRELAYAEAANTHDPEAEAWLAGLREELASRKSAVLKCEQCGARQDAEHTLCSNCGADLSYP